MSIRLKTDESYSLTAVVARSALQNRRCVERQSTLGRAFELARSGRVSSVAELRRVLKQELHDVAQVQGRQLIPQLKDLILAARAQSSPETAQSRRSC
jgi:hypothetical protein